jgi:hypothetical protein
MGAVLEGHDGWNSTAELGSVQPVMADPFWFSFIFFLQTVQPLAALGF